MNHLSIKLNKIISILLKLLWLYLDKNELCQIFGHQLFFPDSLLLADTCGKMVLQDSFWINKNALILIHNSFYFTMKFLLVY